MQSTTSKNNTPLSNLFVLDNFDGEMQQSFIAEVGTLVFQSALMKYLSGVEESESADFELFLSNNAEAETFIDILCAEYPDFEEILSGEIKSFQSEFIL